jgi:hypothetical protein
VALSKSLLVLLLCCPLALHGIFANNTFLRLPGHCYLSVQALEKKEIVALDAAEKSISSLNFSVSQEIQTLFDRLAFM